MLSSLSLNDQHFPKFTRGIDSCDFLFSKKFQNFITFLLKEQLKDCLIITTSNLKRKIQKIRISSSQYFKGINFYIKKYCSKFTGGLDSVEYLIYFSNFCKLYINIQTFQTFKIVWIMEVIRKYQLINT